MSIGLDSPEQDPMHYLDISRKASLFNKPKLKLDASEKKSIGSVQNSAIRALEAASNNVLHSNDPETLKKWQLVSEAAYDAVNDKPVIATIKGFVKNIFYSSSNQKPTKKGTQELNRNYLEFTKKAEFAELILPILKEFPPQEKENVYNAFVELLKDVPKDRKKETVKFLKEILEKNPKISLESLKILTPFVIKSQKKDRKDLLEAIGCTNSLITTINNPSHDPQKVSDNLSAVSKHLDQVPIRKLKALISLIDLAAFRANPSVIETNSILKKANQLLYLLNRLPEKDKQIEYLREIKDPTHKKIDLLYYYVSRGLIKLPEMKNFVTYLERFSQKDYEQATYLYLELEGQRDSLEPLFLGRSKKSKDENHLNFYKEILHLANKDDRLELLQKLLSVDINVPKMSSRELKSFVKNLNISTSESAVAIGKKINKAYERINAENEEA